MQITREMGRNVLRADELPIHDALSCKDLVADITVKVSKDINKFNRRKPENRTPEMVDRINAASKHFGGFADATMPAITDVFITRLMVSRCERNALVEQSRSLMGFLAEFMETNPQGDDLKAHRLELGTRLEELTVFLSEIEVSGKWGLEGEALKDGG